MVFSDSSSDEDVRNRHEDNRDRDRDRDRRRKHQRKKHKKSSSSRRRGSSSRHKHDKKHRWRSYSSGSESGLGSGVEKETSYDSDRNARDVRDIDKDRDSSGDEKERRRRKKHKKRSHRDRDRDRDRDKDRDRASSDKSSSKRRRTERHIERESWEGRRREKKKQEEKNQNGASSTPNNSANAFLSQLYSLLSISKSSNTHAPQLATELPYMLIRMSSGASINLSQMPDPSVAHSLRLVFDALGCKCHQGDDEWKFESKSASSFLGTRNANGNGNGSANAHDAELALIRLANQWMDECGITMEAIESYEASKDVENVEEDQGQDPRGSSERHLQPRPHPLKTLPDIRSEIASLTQMLLEKFQSKADAEARVSSSSSSPPSSLSKELYGVMTMILEGESICLDGIPDEELRNAIEKLFMVVGLSKEEMEVDSDSDGDGDDQGDNDQSEPMSYGYMLPEKTNELYQGIYAKLEAAVGACKTVHQELLQRQQQKASPSCTKRMLGPSRPPPNASQTTSAFDALQPESESDDDEDDGPAPLGTIMAKKRLMKGPALTSQQVKQMAEERQRQGHAASGEDMGGREEWMLQPGEHDFLKGVMSKGIQNRTFRNQKHKDTKSALAAAADEPPLDPSIQRELDKVAKLHHESRGPSLVEQHRQQKAEEKAAKKAAAKSGGGGGRDWSWNRDQDLDKGRRVDKNHLHMVMGGASSDLKSKFQGSFSKGFT